MNMWIYDSVFILICALICIYAYTVENKYEKKNMNYQLCYELKNIKCNFSKLEYEK